MLKIEANNKSFNIPTSWGEIKFGAYLEYLSKLLPEPSDPVEHIAWEYEVVARFAGFPENFKDIFPYRDTAGCFALISEAITAEPKHAEIDRFVLNGIEYLCPESSIVMGQKIPMQKITTAELVDCMTMAKDFKAATSAAATDITCMPLIIGTLYRPDGEQYDSNKTHERALLFSDLPMDIVWGCAFFLGKCLNLSNTLTVDYLKKQP